MQQNECVKSLMSPDMRAFTVLTSAKLINLKILESTTIPWISYSLSDHNSNTQVIRDRVIVLISVISLPPGLPHRFFTCHHIIYMYYV